MKKYEVEFRRTSYITVWVEAENEDHAAAKAWDENSYDPVNDDASWEIDSIKETNQGESK